MTRPIKKAQERFFVEQTAKFLGANWIIEAAEEGPDFLVIAGEEKFGLEVSEIFTGPQSQSGSFMKGAESINQNKLDALREKYEALQNTPLRARFVGDLSVENLAGAVTAIIKYDFASKPIGHHLVIDEDNGLRVLVTRALRAEWFSINDRVGWVDRNPHTKIADAIKDKSKKLDRYLECAGPDIRLLLVANRMNNSGKLHLQAQAKFDFCGFAKVYFLSYPEAALELVS